MHSTSGLVFLCKGLHDSQQFTKDKWYYARAGRLPRHSNPSIVYQKILLLFILDKSTSNSESIEALAELCTLQILLFFYAKSSFISSISRKTKQYRETSLSFNSLYCLLKDTSVHPPDVMKPTSFILSCMGFYGGITASNLWSILASCFKSTAARHSAGAVENEST